MISIDPSIKLLTPNIRLGIVTGQVKVVPSERTLLEKISLYITQLRETEILSGIHSKKTINETRQAYKLYGKEPSRYRPSAEALRRRILKGKDIYHVNNVVEIINWCSLDSGFSIGGYDAQHLLGTLTLRLGREAEEYTAIGRGNLNIRFLPVLADEISSFGSPTSDSERTMITENTKRVMLVYFDFFGNAGLNKSMEMIESRLKEHAYGSDFRILMAN